MIKNLKEEIIKYVLESSEAENKNLSVFIAGMQAQKQITNESTEFDASQIKVPIKLAVNHG
ncbi:hypothetical protein E4O00_03270 [Treponema sp. OMZ 788]|uniref:hypothetical protein n=1 Tax=Treponema sp. OMZ 788 TaxID=2563664 RepID=UPI0020A4DF95|nr:hypothetical protein [Treponema sp. OMZ 788]UTC65200.1 hypothetical protein E4O00_03270 [Treponema sp. OMZ 788]